MSERALLAAAYAGFNGRDIDAVFALMSPEVDWPNGMEGGRVRGYDEVRAYWTRQWSMVDPHVEPVGMAADEDGRIIVDVHQVVRDLSGKVVADLMVQHVYTIRGGLIERMDIRDVEKSHLAPTPL